MYRPKRSYSMLALLVAAGMLVACGGAPAAPFADSSAATPLPAAAAQQETAPAQGDMSAVQSAQCSIATSKSPAPQIGDGTPLAVYVGSGDGTLYAIDAADGKQLWRYASGSERQTGTWLPPTVVDEAVYVDVEQYVHAVAAKDGKQLWRYDVGSAYVTPPAVDTGKVYVGGDDGFVHGLDANDGKELWRFEAGSWVYPPTAAKDVAYAGNDEGVLFAIDAKDGHQRWRLQMMAPIRARPVVLDDLIYVSASTSLYAVKLSDGTARWRYEVGTTVGLDTPAVDNHVVYVTTFDENNNKAQLLALSEGKRCWQHDFEGWLTPPAVADGVVYVGSGTGALRAFATKDGKLLWEAKPGGPLATPAFANGRLYVGSEDRHVYALDAADGKTLWSFETSASAGPPALAARRP